MDIVHNIINNSVDLLLFSLVGIFIAPLLAPALLFSFRPETFHQGIFIRSSSPLLRWGSAYIVSVGAMMLMCGLFVLASALMIASVQ